MGIIKADEIAGYCFGGEMVCLECVQSDELTDLRKDDVLVRNDVESSEDMYFCDRCGKEL
jgi:hypothetical protein